MTTPIFKVTCLWQIVYIWLALVIAHNLVCHHYTFLSLKILIQQLMFFLPFIFLTPTRTFSHTKYMLLCNIHEQICNHCVVDMPYYFFSYIIIYIHINSGVMHSRNKTWMLKTISSSHIISTQSLFSYCLAEYISYISQ